MRDVRLLVCSAAVVLALALYFISASARRRISVGKLPEPIPPSTEKNTVGQLSTPFPEKTGMFQENARMIVGFSNVPIVYFGKTVDQEDKPLEGVVIEYRAQKMVLGLGTIEGQSTVGTVMSGVDGRFTINGINGVGIGFEKLEKEGYVYSQKGSRAQVYSNNGEMSYHPSSLRPEVFTMVAKGVEPTVKKFETHLSLFCDGTSAGFDSKTGKLSSSGDFKITVVRKPLNIVRGGDPYGWRAEVEVVGGGLCEQLGLGPAIAPSDGYVGKIVVTKLATDSPWVAGFKKAVWFRTADGCYGLANIDVDTLYQPPPAKARVSYALNKSPGRHSLESAQP